MLENVRHLLYNDTRVALVAQDPTTEVKPSISAEIYRIVRRINFGMATTALSRLREDHTSLDVIEVFNTEIKKRKPLLPVSTGSKEVRAIAAIKFDLACASEESTYKAMKELQATNAARYSRIIGPFDCMRREGLKVLLYTGLMGSPAALMVWPWTAVHSATGFTLHRQTGVFIQAIVAFILASSDFLYIKALINHISTWFEGWVLGKIRAVEAIDQLGEFLREYNKGMVPSMRQLAHVLFVTTDPSMARFRILSPYSPTSLAQHRKPTRL
jgi:hypothetical protein